MAFDFPALDAVMASQHQGQSLLLDQEEKRGQIAQRNEQVQASKLANMASLEQKKDRDALSLWMQSESQQRNGKAASAAENAKMYSEASRFALTRGDFQGAKEMEGLAKGELGNAERERMLVEKQETDRAEELSVAAQDVAMNPTPESHKKLLNSAIAAGVSPEQIPLPGTPEYVAFVQQSGLASMKGKDRLQFLEKIREHEATAKDRKEAAAQRHADQVEARRDRALAREQATAIAQQGLDIRKQLAESTLEARAAKAAASGAGAVDPKTGLPYGKISSTMERQAVAVTNAANEAGQALVRMSDMSTSMRAGVFGHLEDPKTILKSLNTTGTNKMIQEDVQMMQANMQLLGLEVAQAMAAPYKPNKEQISEARRMAEPIAGDTEYTAMYKMALVADVMKARLESTPRTAMLQEAREHAEKNFARFPSAAEVYQHAKERGIKLKVRKEGKTFMDKLRTMGGNEQPQPMDTEVDPGFAPANPAPPAAARQNLLDLYPAR